MRKFEQMKTACPRCGGELCFSCWKCEEKFLETSVARAFWLAASGGFILGIVFCMFLDSL